MKPVTEHRKFDSIEDYLAFEEKSELRHEYYFLVEPDKHLVIVHKKMADNEWQTETYTSITDTIELPILQVSIALKDIYQA